MKNNKLFPSILVDFFFNGKDLSSKKHFIKIKSNKNISKYELKLFIFDTYNQKINKMHSNIVRSKKKSSFNSNQKKVFWIEL